LQYGRAFRAVPGMDNSLKYHVTPKATSQSIAIALFYY
jgi:hypothetical protein